MKQNKTGRYLKYAIGKIALVLIGVLMVLGINEWYSNRITQNTITRFYERIIVELDAEIAAAHNNNIKNDQILPSNSSKFTLGK